MNYSQNINLSDPNDYTHIDKPIARNNNVNPVTWVNFIEFSSVDNFGYGELGGSIGGTWLDVLDKLNNLFNNLNNRVTELENRESSGGNQGSQGDTPTPQQYIVTLNVTNCTKIPNNQQTVTSGGSVSWTITPNSGYKMPTWVNDANISGNIVTVSNVTSDKTINLECEPISVTQYTVKLTVNYGSITSGQAEQKVDSGGSALWTVTPNSGYKMPSSVSGATISGNTVTVSNVTSNQTINLTCEQITVTQYTVTYNANGGSSTPTKQTVNAGSSVTLASAISRNADSSYTYTFAGWNTNSEGTGTNYNAGASYTPDGDITLYAKWNRTAKYTVTYNANEGNSTPESQTVNAGSSVTLASAISRNEDANYTYTFAGWNTQSNGRGTNYAAGQQITLSSNLKLYAKWDAHQKQVTQYYFSVGTTAPTASNYTTANNATTTIPTTKEFTNNSGSKASIYILVPSNKTITIVDASIQSPIAFSEDTSVNITNHKVYKTTGRIANGGGIKITIS